MSEVLLCTAIVWWHPALGRHQRSRYTPHVDAVSPRHPTPDTRNPKPETRNPKHENRNPKHETRSPKEVDLRGFLWHSRKFEDAEEEQDHAVEVWGFCNEYRSESESVAKEPVLL